MREALVTATVIIIKIYYDLFHMPSAVPYRTHAHIHTHTPPKKTQATPQHSEIH